jgi:hypothetical protein
MKSNKRVRREKKLLVHEAEGVAGGMVAGAALGAVAGPPGIVTGAVIGAAAGALSALVLDRDGGERAERTGKLDDEIGVSAGELGAPNLKHPPAKTGAYSGGSAGAAATSGEGPAEGPMQTPEE